MCPLPDGRGQPRTERPSISQIKSNIVKYLAASRGGTPHAPEGLRSLLSFLLVLSLAIFLPKCSMWNDRPASLAWFGSKVMASMVYKLTVHDPVGVTAAGAGVLVVALLAAWLPTRWAANLEPMALLRNE